MKMNEVKILGEFIVQHLSDQNEIESKLNTSSWSCIYQFDETNISLIFTHKLNVEFIFRIKIYADYIQFINIHRLSTDSKKGNGTNCYNELLRVFNNICLNLEKIEYIVIFEISGNIGTKPEITKAWLEKLGFQKTKDKFPQKYIRTYKVN